MSPRPLAVAAVYGAGFLQGLALVSFPASSSVLREMQGLSDAQYGAIFLPQVVLAVAGAFGGGMLARRLGLKRLLWIALLANGLSQLLLAMTTFATTGLAYWLLLAGTGLVGLGFGLSGAPLNSYPPQFFPARRNSAVLALHSLVGLGLMAGPLLLNPFVARDSWLGFPLLLMTLCLGLALLTAFLALGEQTIAGTDLRANASSSAPSRSGSFWAFVAIAILYAFAEGTFSNWAVVYLQEAKGQSAAVAALALSVFWGALVAGRLIAAGLVLKIPAQTVWFALPILMTVTFLLLPSINSPIAGVGLFALAGLACSAFFPLSIAIVSSRFPDDVAWVSSMLIAALMVGVGLGSFTVGALRATLSLEHLYLLSSVYPIVVIALAVPLIRNGHMRQPVSANGR